MNAVNIYQLNLTIKRQINQRAGIVIMFVATVLIINQRSYTYDVIIEVFVIVGSVGFTKAGNS